MTSTLLAIIGLLLIFNAWQLRQHERWVTDVVERLTPAPPQYFVPTPRPAPLPRPLSDAEILGETVYPLTRRTDQALTVRMPYPIHPRFESYGVDVSFAPTIGIEAP